MCRQARSRRRLNAAESSNVDSGRAQVFLDLGDAEGAKVKDARGENGVRPGVSGGHEMINGASATGGDERHANHVTHLLDHVDIETVRGAVRVHRVEKDLAGAELLAEASPLDRV